MKFMNVLSRISKLLNVYSAAIFMRTNDNSCELSLVRIFICRNRHSSESPINLISKLNNMSEHSSHLLLHSFVKNLTLMHHSSQYHSLVVRGNGQPDQNLHLGPGKLTALGSFREELLVPRSKALLWCEPLISETNLPRREWNHDDKCEYNLSQQA